MSPDKDKLLCEKFPKLYADRHKSMQETSMCWGFETGDGWFHIIYDLSEKLEALIEKEEPTCEICGDDATRCTCNKFVPYWPRASQVKEKFGGLRFYMTSETEAMAAHIHEAMENSFKTCEECGAPGSRRCNCGWLLTMCQSCYDVYLKTHPVPPPREETDEDETA